MYRVRAIVVHTGEGEDEDEGGGDGHYLCYHRQDSEGGREWWWRVNDSEATRCRDTAAVLTSDEVVKGAFLLLYEAFGAEEGERLDEGTFDISAHLSDAVTARNERLCAKGLLGLYKGIDE